MVTPLEETDIGSYNDAFIRFYFSKHQTIEMRVPIDIKVKECSFADAEFSKV